MGRMAAPDAEVRWWVRVLAGFPLPLLALVLHLLLFPPEARIPWLLFGPAVFFSGWLGGLVAGVTATLLSMALVGWFILPQHGITIGSFWLFQLLLVLLVGTLASLLFDRYRRTVRQLRAANRSLEAEKARLIAAERSVQDARQRMQLAADSAGVAIWSHDFRDRNGGLG